MVPSRRRPKIGKNWTRAVLGRVAMVRNAIVVFFVVHVASLSTLLISLPLLLLSLCFICFVLTGSGLRFLQERRATVARFGLGRARTSAIR